jgi:hypothetical protein
MQRNAQFAWLSVVLGVFAVAVQYPASVAGEPPTKSERPRLYDTSADGKQQIAAALKTAQAENKRILLKFGANW